MPLHNFASSITIVFFSHIILQTSFILFKSYFVAVPLLQAILDYFFSSSLEPENHISSHHVFMSFWSLSTVPLSLLELTVTLSFKEVVDMFNSLLFSPSDH